MAPDLHRAIGGDEVRQALAAGAPLEAPDEKGLTALMVAARLGREHAVEALLAARADPRARDPRGRTPLHHAAEGDNFAAIVCALVDAGAELDALDAEGRTALDLAIARGQLRVQDALVSCGAATERLAPSAALLLAARRGELATVERLLAAGADPDAADDGGYSPLLWAAIDHAPAEVFAALLRAGARPDKPSRSGETPLMRARRRPEVARLLLDAGADANAMAASGRTPLRSAAEANDVAVMRVLIAAGADARTAPGSMTLLESARGWAGRDAEAVRVLLEAGAAVADDLLDAAAGGRLAELKAIVASGVDVNALGSGGRHALVEALRLGQDDVVAWLLQAGADPFVVTADFQTAFGASKKASPRAGQLLAEAAGRVPRSEPRVLLFACLVGHLDLVRRCLTQGADPNATDPLGEPAIMKAAGVGHGPVVSRLVAAGAQVDARDAVLGATSLVIAAARGDAEMVDVLLRAGADVNAVARGVEQDGECLLTGETALIAAAERGHGAVVDRLLAAGADVHVRRRDGLDAAAVAAAAGNVSLAARLRDAR